MGPLVSAIFLGCMIGPGESPAIPLVSGYVNNSGVKLHYVTAGKGPLCILLHGFPDFHYSWRDQIPVLAKHFKVVALDLRGFNLSDKPAGIEAYEMEKLTSDVNALLGHFGKDKAIIVGHDWGGAIAWSFAMRHPDKTERLVVLNLPHPNGLQRELANNAQQHKNSEYARNFQLPQAASLVRPEMLVNWVKEPEARKVYLEAMKRSSMEGMLNYYKANYPRPPYKMENRLPLIKCPVLLIHGLDDQYLLPGALNDTWKWLDKELMLVTIPGAGHFVHRDKPDRVNRIILDWLKAAKPE